MKIPEIPFEPFSKMARFSREVLISEKIDGTNSTIFINENNEIFAASRNRWITPEDDNYGFAAWVDRNKIELLKLGFGLHRGEWWGQGIQRNYGLKERRFSLFNVSRWINDESERIDPKQEIKPACCHIVPVIFRGPMDSINEMVKDAVGELIHKGSRAAPGFPEPEGVIIWHTAANIGFKKTLVDDHKHKSQ